MSTRTHTAARTGIRTAARNAFLQDILCTAVEGGSTYWAEVESYAWDDDFPETAQAILVDSEADDPRILLTVDVIATGLRRAIAAGLPCSADLAEASRENEAGDIDGVLADVIVQFAVFGELVYG